MERDKIFILNIFIILCLYVPRTVAQQDSTLFMENAVETMEMQLEDLEDAENVSEDLLERMEDGVRTSTTSATRWLSPGFC